MSREKIEQICESVFSENGKLQNKGSKEFHLGKNKILQNAYGELKIVAVSNKNTKKNLNCNKKIEFSDKIKILKENQSIEWYNYKIALYKNIKDFETYFIDEKDMDYAYYKFDNEKMKDGKIIVRSRKDGDRILLKNLGHKKVKKILIDEKVMKWDRDSVPIVEIEIDEVLSGPEAGNNEIIEIKNEKKCKKLKEILAVSDIKFSKFLEKVQKKDIKELENNNKSKLLIIGRKNGRKR